MGLWTHWTDWTLIYFSSLKLAPNGPVELCEEAISRDSITLRQRFAKGADASNVPKAPFYNGFCLDA
jgi:hypothetical protein